MFHVHHKLFQGSTRPYYKWEKGKGQLKCVMYVINCLHLLIKYIFQVMGNIYFNLVKVECVEGRGHDWNFRQAKDGF